MSVEIGFEAFADLSDKVNRMHRSMVSHKPIYKEVSGSLVVPAGATTGVIETWPRASVGRMYNILSVNIFGSDAHTTLANVIVDVFASTLSDPNTPPLNKCIVSGGSGNVPSITRYSKQVEWCDPQESIFGVVSGATAGQQIVLIVKVADYAIEHYEAMHI